MVSLNITGHEWQNRPRKQPISSDVENRTEQPLPHPIPLWASLGLEPFLLGGKEMREGALSSQRMGGACLELQITQVAPLSCSYLHWERACEQPWRSLMVITRPNYEAGPR